MNSVCWEPKPVPLLGYPENPYRQFVFLLGKPYVRNIEYRETQITECRFFSMGMLKMKSPLQYHFYLQNEWLYTLIMHHYSLSPYNNIYRVIKIFIFLPVQNLALFYSQLQIWLTDINLCVLLLLKHLQQASKHTCMLESSNLEYHFPFFTVAAGIIWCDCDDRLSTATK